MSDGAGYVFLCLSFLYITIVYPISIVVVVDYSNTMQYSEEVCSNTPIHSGKDQVGYTTWYTGEALVFSPSLNRTVLLEVPPQKLIRYSKEEVNDWLASFTTGTTDCYIDNPLAEGVPRGIKDHLNSIGWWIFSVVLGSLLLTCVCAYAIHECLVK